MSLRGEDEGERRTCIAFLRADMVCAGASEVVVVVAECVVVDEREGIEGVSGREAILYGESEGRRDAVLKTWIWSGGSSEPPRDYATGHTTSWAWH